MTESELSVQEHLLEQRFPWGALHGTADLAGRFVEVAGLGTGFVHEFIEGATAFNDSMHLVEFERCGKQLVLLRRPNFKLFWNNGAYWRPLAKEEGAATALALAATREADARASLARLTDEQVAWAFTRKQLQAGVWSPKNFEHEEGTGPASAPANGIVLAAASLTGLLPPAFAFSWAVAARADDLLALRHGARQPTAQDCALLPGASSPTPLDALCDLVAAEVAAAQAQVAAAEELRGAALRDAAKHRRRHHEKTAAAEKAATAASFRELSAVSAPSHAIVSSFN